MKALAWPGPIEQTHRQRWASLERPSELLQRGSRDAIFWSPSQRGPLFAHNHVVTVLDCINVEYTYRGDWRLPLLRRMSEAVLRNAACIVAISHATRDAILRNYSVEPSKVVVIPGPIHLRPHAAAVSPPGDVQPRRFALMVTNSLPHKNTALAAHAFANSRAAAQGVALRVVGSIDPEGLARCRAAGIKVDLRRGVSEEDLSRWFSQAEFLLSPSLDEGLNLPVAEALAHNGRVLCSDIPVHREFYDGRVSFFDPQSIDGIISSLNEALSVERSEWKPHSMATGPSFEDVASQYRALFLRLAAT